MIGAQTHVHRFLDIDYLCKFHMKEQKNVFSQPKGSNMLNSIKTDIKAKYYILNVICKKQKNNSGSNIMC